MNSNLKLKRVGVYGISGTGKTSIVKLVEKYSDNTIWLEGSRLVLEAANMTLEEFKRQTTDDEKYAIRERAIKIAETIQAQEQKHIVLDGHLAFVNKNGVFENVMTNQDQLFYTHFIYLKLTPKVVWSRQQNDTSKKRNYSLQTIEEWMKFEEKELLNAAMTYNINFSLLENEDLDTCVSYVLSVINP